MLNHSISPVFCFGKLPNFGDFIRYNAAAPEVQSFDRWLQEGLFHARNHFKSDWEERFSSQPYYQFLFGDADSRNFLIGYLRPSRDKAGRRYPFLVGRLVAVTELQRYMPHRIPLLFPSFSAEAWKLSDSADNWQSAEEVTKHMQNLGNLSVDTSGSTADEYQAFQENTSLDELVGSFAQIGSNDEFLYVVQQIIEALVPLRGMDLSCLAYGFKLPISPGTPLNACTTAFWLEVLEKLMRRAPSPVCLFWSRPDTVRQANLFLFFRVPVSKSLLNLMQPETESEALYAPVTGNFSQDYWGYESFSQRLGFDSPPEPFTVKQVLQGLARI